MVKENIFIDQGLGWREKALEFEVVSLQMIGSGEVGGSQRQRLLSLVPRDLHYHGKIDQKCIIIERFCFEYWFESNFRISVFVEVI